MRMLGSLCPDPSTKSLKTDSYQPSYRLLTSFFPPLFGATLSLPPKQRHDGLPDFGTPQAIPFRSSKLTFLLRESLAGNSRTCLGREKIFAGFWWARAARREGNTGQMFGENRKSSILSSRKSRDVDDFPFQKGFVSCWTGTILRRRCAVRGSW